MAKKQTETEAEGAATEAKASDATTETEASGAMIEPEAKAVEAGHPAVDATPRANTTAEQNQQDWNDPKKRKPSAEDYVGQGLDPAPYGKAAK